MRTTMRHEGVINDCYGGFGISDLALSWLKKNASEETKKKIRKHEHDKVKHVLMLVVMVQIKQIERQHTLKHIVEQKVVPPRVKSRLYLDLKVTNADKAHHIVCRDAHLIRVAGVQYGHDRSIAHPIIRRFDAIWEDEQVLILPTQLRHSLIRYGE